MLELHAVSAEQFSLCPDGHAHGYTEETFYVLFSSMYVHFEEEWVLKQAHTEAKDAAVTIDMPEFIERMRVLARAGTLLKKAPKPEPEAEGVGDASRGCTITHTPPDELMSVITQSRLFKELQPTAHTKLASLLQVCASCAKIVNW